ncbi:glycoside hydrolase family 9 protein [Carboxylicivirga sp. M1479]|uniref:glycoside hydrolase family 9 protein n=1 Tax=Carboxylicivirga sp. M1479 TaxID=2594476 RepID=UPI00117887E8|nr:glycoside hydrolase family 9 protein [Carboxylicivirga sp. M1479]TRX71787.1 cellulase [Carboxylicivirga sp. M1479]
MKVKIANYSQILFIVICTFLSGVATAQHMNQYAFHSASVKRVFLPEVNAGQSFKVLDAKGNELVSAMVTEAKLWEYSNTSVAVADFSSLVDEGSYEVIIDGSDSSITFSITDNAYREPGTSLIKSYYMARATEPILEKHAGEYARLAGHPDDKVVIHPSAASKERPAGSTIASPGGWYDAGDYGKYIVNSSISTFTLLHLYELFPQYLKGLELNIPESGDKVADLLDETLVNLRWMMTMQDPHDGGVYHKLTTKKFCGMVMPHKDIKDRFVVMKTTAATLDFAATMAKASRILKNENKHLQQLGTECFAAAEKAWAWCKAHPDLLYVQPKDISTGQYDDKEISDEWFWAATELYLASGNKKYKKDIRFDEQKFSQPEWRRVNSLGLYSILSNEKNAKGLNITASKKKVLKMADKLYKQYTESAYRVSIDKFPWGSNGEVMNDGMLLINAYLLSNDQRYLEAADACVAYVMGANPLNKAFVTGYGKNTPMFVHDRRCAADGIEAPIPGLLAGGPTNSVQSDCGETAYGTKIPAMSYVDMECSYSTNEVAINWNAPAVFVFLGLDAIYSSK